MPVEFVRVTDKQVNAVRTIPKHVAEKKPQRYQIHADQDPLDRNGRPKKTLNKKPLGGDAPQPQAAPTPKVN